MEDKWEDKWEDKCFYCRKPPLQVFYKKDVLKNIAKF